MALSQIARTFALRFKMSGLTLPLDDLKHRRRGAIQEQGWLIQYVFGRDGEREYLDYYACHRMTDDTHNRIWEDGEVEGLPALISMRIVSEDPEEDRRLKAEHDARNQAAMAEMERKGFGLFSINQALIRLDAEQSRQEES